MSLVNGARHTAKRPRISRVAKAVQDDIVEHLYSSLGTNLYSATRHDLYSAVALTVRRMMVEGRRLTTEAQYRANQKFVYYLSAEYLLGRQLTQNLFYTGATDTVAEALRGLGVDLKDVLELDPEPGLGNGGLGRLAACYLDSLATLDIPSVGYGIRYEFGIFEQSFVNGWQVEQPDNWSLTGFPWEFPGPDDMIEVGFGGTTEHDGHGVRWLPSTHVLGEPYTVLVPGHHTNTVNILRLWRARATKAFDFRLFNTGDYARAVEQKVVSENISKVLYPNDETPQGRRLRLAQQYFFVSCSIRDIIRRFRIANDDWTTLPDKAVVQLNDTHPVIAIPELMRILLDEEGLGWEVAWDITHRTFAYTCHTLMPEALEKWPVSLLKDLLPRHYEIVAEINRRFLEQVRGTYPGDEARVRRLSIFEESDGKRVRMAHLATVGSFAVNGVARLHSDLLRAHTLHDFAEIWPERFQNKTNGVTPRRFLSLANPRLSNLITAAIGDGWLRDLDGLRALEHHADDAEFRRAWREVKLGNKAELADLVGRHAPVSVDPVSMFDVMVKRLHEYKRQLLKVLHIVALYQRLQDDPSLDIAPRTFVFGAKAAPGYSMAKQIIKLINDVASTVNASTLVAGRLRVAFLPNFNVSIGERVYPAAELSEQISLAGTEASGTGNMKFAINGALTVGTLDGANVEIRELVGPENFFLFGLTEPQVADLRRRGYHAYDYYRANPVLARVVDAIACGEFSGGDREVARPIVESLLRRDAYLVLADFEGYIDAQTRIDDAYRDADRWTRMSILNCARSGYFSSDRAIREYCSEIWRASPVPVPEE
jgi:starch phosphorylase